MQLSNLEVLNLHASGGMAEVYRARVVGDDGVERQYAVKKILPAYTRDKEILKMFVEEARVAALLDHDCVVRVHDLCTADTGEYFIVMEFADGRDLSDVIWEASQKQQRLPLGMVVQAARDVLRALDYAWNAVDDDGVQLKLIHRDISPHNVLVTWDGRIKLTDFGIAKVQASANKTQMGVIKGKFGYMSPEQARGKPLDQRSDLFNVGILLYEGFTGTRLFEGPTDLETLDAMRSPRVPRLPAELAIPAALEAVMRLALEREPDERFPDAMTFSRALAAAQQQAGVVVRSAETALTMRRLFPDLAVEPVVHATRQLALKSQLWQAPVIMAGGRASPLPELGQAGVSSMGAARALPENAAAAARTALPASRRGPAAVVAGVKAGGAVRSLDDRSSASTVRPRSVQPLPDLPAPRVRALDDDARVARPAAPAPAPLPVTSIARPAPHQPARSPAPAPYQPAPSPAPYQPAPSPAPYQPAPSPAPYQPAPYEPPAAPYQPPPAAPYEPPAAPYQPPAAPYQPPAAPYQPPAAPYQPLAAPYQPPAAPYQPPPAPAPYQPPAAPYQPPAAPYQPPAAPYQPAPAAPYQPAPAPPPALSTPMAVRPPPPPPVVAAALGPPPPPLGMSFTSALPVSAADAVVWPAAVGAEGRFTGVEMLASGAEAPAVVVRRARWRVHGEAAFETWLPAGARVAAAVAVVVGVVVGFGVAAGMRAALAGEPSSLRTLIVRSTPAAASVTIDDRRLDELTPLVVDVRLDDGAHVVKVALAAGGPVQRTITLAAGDRSLTMSENLQSNGSVRIESRPSGARVLLDGRDVGLAPVVVPSVATDKLHLVEARKPGFKTATATVPVQRPPELLVSLVLEAQEQGGKVVLTTAVPATIELDGTPWGTTSALERQCAPGRHDVVVRVAALGIEKRSVIDVPERGVARYFISLD